MLNIRDAEINPIGLGTWNIGENKSTYQNEVDAIRYAIDNGVYVIDTAEMYGNGKSEEIIGHSIKNTIGKSCILSLKYYLKMHQKRKF
ncbi:aldo/keto reductase [Mammaliicoccus sciuri]|uniref:aldo/keto reductase n=1 Tax=Mammaliicoccus sciuri TaxID=1296 RepID=UPI002DBEB99E|nr:aldo/keto reductase [Mammaliicoccus sciuri]